MLGDSCKLCLRYVLTGVLRRPEHSLLSTVITLCCAPVLRTGGGAAPGSERFGSRLSVAAAFGACCRRHRCRGGTRATVGLPGSATCAQRAIEEDPQSGILLPVAHEGEGGDPP